MPCLNSKTIIPGIRIPIIMMGQPGDCLIFIMGIPMQVRQCLDIETPPRHDDPVCNGLLMSILIMFHLRRHFKESCHLNHRCYFGGGVSVVSTCII